MKFACDRCGKRYASVDEPAAGRVYRIRCRCGHEIVVRGPSPAPPDEAAARARSFEPPPLPPPLASPEPPPEPSPVAAAVSPPDVAHDAPSALVDERLRRAKERHPRDAIGAAAAPGEPAGHEEGAATSAAHGALAAAGQPVLSLGLEDDGASGARRRVLLASIAALLAAGTALALWRM